MRAFGRRAPALAGLLLFFGRALSAASASEALDRYHRGETLYSRGELEAALAEFQGALALDPRAHRGARVGMHFEDYDPQFQIGRIQARLGRFAEARKAFDACAAAGYTERSENAEEYRRWRSIAEQAAASGPPSSPGASASPAPAQPMPASPAAPPATTTPSAAPPPVSAEPAPKSSRPAGAAAQTATKEREPAKTAAPPPANTASAAPPRGEEVVRVAPPLRPETQSPATARPSPPAATAAQPPAKPKPASPALSWAWLAAAAAALLLGALAAFRGRARLSETDELSFGRFAIGDLVAAGRGSFVYSGSDRKSREPVVLKLRRVARGAGEPDRFERESRVLEALRRSPAASLGPRLVARGASRRGGRAAEFVALERLDGRTLIDFSRNARRRLDTLLCVDILRAIVAALRKGREAGLGHEDLEADDIFLLEPLPANAGNPVGLRILGWTERRTDTDSEVRGVASIAAEIFRGRARSSEDAGALDRAPSPLKEVLLRIRGGGSLPSLEEISAALDACRRPSGDAKEAAP